MFRSGWLTVVLLAVSVQTGGSTTEALSLAKTRDQALYDAFNAGYRLTPSGIVEQVEIITEFRRAVLIAHQRVEQGDFAFTAQDLASAMAPFEGLVGAIAIVRLNPLNTYAQAPAYEIYVRTGPSTPPLGPRNLKRDPMYPLGLSQKAVAMVGVRLQADFSRSDIASASNPTLVILDPSGATVWEGRIDLSRYR